MWTPWSWSQMNPFDPHLDLNQTLNLLMVFPSTSPRQPHINTQFLSRGQGSSSGAVTQYAAADFLPLENLIGQILHPGHLGQDLDQGRVQLSEAFADSGNIPDGAQHLLKGLHEGQEHLHRVHQGPVQVGVDRQVCLSQWFHQFLSQVILVLQQILEVNTEHLQRLEPTSKVNLVGDVCAPFLRPQHVHLQLQLLQLSLHSDSLFSPVQVWGEGGASIRGGGVYLLLRHCSSGDTPGQETRRRRHRERTQIPPRHLRKRPSTGVKCPFPVGVRR